MDQDLLCRGCGAPIQPGSRFCAACGHQVEQRPREGERRQLTAVFCDLVGSSELSERLDPEELQDLFTSYRTVCRNAIDRHLGHLSQFLGDGVLAYFGYPVAQEEDAVRAVQTALQIIEDLELVDQGIGKRLQAETHVRVGIHSGLAVVGDVGPGGRDRLAVGETVNLAARIQSLADLDTILVSGATARLVEGHFELRALGARTLRGFTKPVELFRVVRPTGAQTKFEAAARGTLSPYVGRESELAELAAAWREVQAGADRVVVVRGEAGIGKSRIVHQFQRAVLREGAFVAKCFCSPLMQATAFGPLIEMLNAGVTERAEGKTAPGARLEALGSLLGEHAGVGADAFPLMAALLSIPGADEGAIRELSSARRRGRTLEILRAWLASSAERLPYALIVEDVHWADPSTLDFLDLIVRDRPGGRTLLCVAGRPEFLVRWSQPHVRTIELLRLTNAEVETMVQNLTGGYALPPVILQGIAKRSEGVPLFVEEVTKAVLESGVLRLDARYELTSGFDERFLPPTVQESLVARFDRLGEGRGVAQLGAAIGREFDYALIRAVAGLTDDELRKHLDALVRSELAFVRGVPPSSTYRFKHALIQDAIYETQLKSARPHVHQRIFTALEEASPELIAERPEMAAYHAEMAGRQEAAVPLLRDAGVAALGRAAVAEAVKHLAHGVELVQVVEEPTRSTLETELQAALGPAYMSTAGWAAPEVERSSKRLRELAAARRDGCRLYQAMWGLWTVHFLRGELETALAVARQVLDMARSAGDPMLQVTGHHALGYTHFYRGEYTGAIQHADEGLALFDLEQERRIASVFQLSSSCVLWFFRAQAYQMLGNARQARDGARRCRELASELRHVPSRIFLLLQCHYYRYLHDVEQMYAITPQLRTLALAEGFVHWAVAADVFLGWMDAQRGEDPVAAAEQIRTALELLHKRRSYLVEPEAASMYAETLLLAGKLEEAVAVTQEARTISEQGHQHHAVSELFRLQGEATSAMGDRTQAAALYNRGIESARATGAKLLELRSALALAHRQPGSRELAELRSVVNCLASAHDQPDYQRAQALLEAHSAARDGTSGA